uniref:Predicted protein n=1 Tax=Physcomitrium patens TaxID=3218 RepID=A9U3M9_PHYPA
MAIESTKRATDIEESGQNVKAKRNLGPLSIFLRRSDSLPSINVALVEEYIANYDPQDGSSVVQGCIIGIDEKIFEKVLFLPAREITMGVEESNDIRPRSYFKGGMSSFEKSLGWQTAEAITPELMEWLRFMLRHLGLYRHNTYMSRRLMFAVVGTFEGMVFNWAAYIATRIHAEMEAKHKLGKFTALLCSNYVYAVIAYTLRQTSPIEGSSESVPVPPQQE